MAVDGDRPQGEVEFEANGSGSFGSRLGEEFDELGRFESHRRGCATGAMIAEGGESKAAAAAECDLPEVAAVEGVEDLAPLSGSAGAVHAAPSCGSRRTVDGPGRALTMFKWLNRRSQRKRYTWAQFGELWSGSWHVPRPRVVEKVIVNAQGEFVVEPEESGC
jgi:hypothetical protein